MDVFKNLFKKNAAFTSGLTRRGGSDRFPGFPVVKHRKETGFRNG